MGKYLYLTKDAKPVWFELPDGLDALQEGVPVAYFLFCKDLANGLCFGTINFCVPEILAYPASLGR